MVYVDLIRGLSMLTIIYAHTNAVLEFELLTKYVYSFQIWIFFFISGYLCKPLISFRMLPSFTIRQFKRLMGAYFACLPLNTFLNYIRGESVHSLIDNIFLQHLSFGATWFLPALFLCETLCICILSCRKGWKFSIIAALACSILAMAASQSGNFHNYFRWQQGLAAVPFFLFGYWYRQKPLPKCGRLSKFTVGVLLLLSGMITCFCNDITHISEMRLGYVPLTYFSGIATIVGIFEIFSSQENYKGPASRFLEWTGQHSLGVLCMHLFCIYLNYHYVLPQPWSPAGIWILLVCNIILSFIEMAILIALWHRFIGWHQYHNVNAM